MTTATTQLSPLSQLHARLLELHRTLLGLVRATYEEEHGTIPNPGAMLQLVIGHEAFAWLRPLSKLLVDLDDKDLVPDAAAARVAVEGLLSGSNPFATRYAEALQSTPEVAAEHGEVMRIVKGLPETLPRVSA
jgi:hypothetical protein